MYHLSRKNPGNVQLPGSAVERRTVMLKNILVPLDGSPRAESALPVAARLARASGGSVMLLRVVTIPLRFYESSTPEAYAPELLDAAIDEVEQYLKALANSEILAGIKTSALALYGEAAQSILSVATSYSMDLIVLTSQGKTGVKRWVLGSVAQKLARHSPIPVLVLHEGGSFPTGPRPESGPVCALVPLDGSALARAALEPAAQVVAALAAPERGVLHLLRVVKPPEIDEQHLSPEEIAHAKLAALHKARVYLQAIVTHLREGPVGKLPLTITWSVALDNDPAGAIIHVAETGEDAEGAGPASRCDLVALATHGRTGFQHWVLGSVTERVLSATRLPILVVRPAPTEFHQVKSGQSAFASIEQAELF
jgi:nucleotide-binding universal stress UspA family protein